MVSDADHTARGPTRRLIDRVGVTGTSGPVAVGLTALAIVSGLTTYSVLTRAAPLAPEPRTVFVLLTLNVLLACLLAMIVFWRVFRLVKERRRGSAGSKLHIRLVGLFSLVAITPAIIVAVFSGLVLDFGIDAWFSKNVNQAITNSRQVASAYVAEHRRNIAIEVAYMATDLNKVAPRLDPASEQSRRDFNAYVRKQAQLRRLSAAFVLDRDGRVFAAWVQPRRVAVQDEPHPPGEPRLDEIERDPIFVQGDIDLPSGAQLRDADDGQIRILDDENDNEIRALFRLAGYQHAYLYVVRPVQPRVLEYYAEALEAANAYTSLEKSRAGIKLTLLSLFFLVAVLILLAAVWIGLWLADRLVAPIARLIAAAERVSRGDLDARVAVGRDGDELSALGTTFNRMTSELSSQRNELVEANRQVDERRRFTEAVLGSLSAGVIGLDQEGRVSLVNKTAARILELDPAQDLGVVLASRIPELTGVLGEALARDEGDRLRGTASRQVDMVRDGRTMNLNIRVTRERSGEDLHGFVVTIDDITELVAAQRTSAWADVARRIAHEIKNPLTPIQLSAERLKRKYAREIKTDPDVFEQCTDTIIRQVTDIGRMADEFSSFARMPAPVIARTNVTELVRQAVFMQKVASPDYDVTLEAPQETIVADCDGRLIAQSLTNILKNAGEAVATRLEAHEAQEGAEAERGRIIVRLDASGYHVMIEVIDNGVGLPKTERHRLTEPYMTTRRKGTGLGLAIVHKVMEDHEGQLILDDAPSGRGALVRLVLPQRNKAVEAKDKSGDTGESVAGTHALAGE